jgi:putative PIN family toxin of toxin-antitoxin system
MTIVIDANVAIAAVAARGLCEAVVELCLERHEVVLCEGILAEIEAKLRDKLLVPTSIIAEYMQLLRNSASVLEPGEVDPGACRDPKDLMVLGLVQPGHVDAIITGDKDLLAIAEFAGARILSPRAFWDTEEERQ